MEFTHLEDDAIREIALKMTYPQLLRFRLTNKHFLNLLADIVALRFAEYVRDNMRFISAGGYHTAFINTQDELYTMGYNYADQVDQLSDRILIPTLIRI